MTIIDEIQPLTKKAVASLIKDRRARSRGRASGGRREVGRWPFPGTVELWVPGNNGEDIYELATCEDLSVQGVGVRSDDPLGIGVELGIAIHEPEISFHGRAVVRHCTENDAGFYTVGLEFVF